MTSLYYHKHGGVAKKSLTEDGREILDFSVNISPIFPPIALLSIVDFALQSYPSIDGRGIKEYYQKKFTLSTSMILSLNGAIEGIYLLPRALELRRIMLLSPSFYEYERAAKIAGAQIVSVPLEAEKGFRLPGIEVLADALIHADAFFAANPNNPTGTEVPPEIIMALASRFPDKWFIVDEAFIQFTPEFPDNSLMGKVLALKNVIVLHSLTKFYALPGLRLGALIAHPEVITRLLDYKEPWTVNAIAESVAVKLLECGAYEESLLAMIVSERERMKVSLTKLDGIRLAGGAANFFLAQWNKGCSLDHLLVYLKNQGIHVRDCRNFFGLEVNYFRFAVRTPLENNRFLDTMQAANRSLKLS